VEGFAAIKSQKLLNITRGNDVPPLIT